MAYVKEARMRIGYPSVLAVTATLMALIAWDATSARPTSQIEPVDRLIRATLCAASSYHVMAGTNATMSIENDGGWCWVDTYVRSDWRALSATSVVVTNPPRHGRVLVGDIDNQEVRIAYRPEPGFGGQDNFSVRYQSNDSDKGFVVVVSKPSTTSASAGPSVIARTTSDSWAYLGRGGGYLNNVSEQAAQTKK
jgi:hypothetical protein